MTRLDETMCAIESNGFSNGGIHGTNILLEQIALSLATIADKFTELTEDCEIKFEIKYEDGGDETDKDD